MDAWMDEKKLHEKRPRRPLLYVIYLGLGGKHIHITNSIVRKINMGFMDIGGA